MVKFISIWVFKFGIGKVLKIVLCCLIFSIFFCSNHIKGFLIHFKGLLRQLVNTRIKRLSTDYKSVPSWYELYNLHIWNF